MQIRDADLDTLEKVVSIIAFGDIEAEDTRHLTELNFIKVFRLAQLTIEYLLYVQDCLQTTNAWLQTDRCDVGHAMGWPRNRPATTGPTSRSTCRLYGCVRRSPFIPPNFPSVSHRLPSVKTAGPTQRSTCRLPGCVCGSWRHT